MIGEYMRKRCRTEPPVGRVSGPAADIHVGPVPGIGEPDQKVRRGRGRPPYGSATAALLLAVTLVACGNGNHANRIRVSGNIELTEVKIAFKTSGKLIERVFDEGDQVEDGAVVARLDQEQLLKQKDQAVASLAAAQSQLRQLQTAIQFQRESIAGQVDERQAQLRQADAQLAELEAGSRAQEIEQARARVDQARTEFEHASADWDRAQPLYEKDDISTALYDQYQAHYSASKAQLDQAEEGYALVKEGPRRQTIEQARARVDQGHAALRLAKAQNLELKRREQEVEARRARDRPRRGAGGAH